MYKGKRLTAERLQEIQERVLFKGWRHLSDGRPIDVFNTSEDSTIRTNNYIGEIEVERDDLLDELEILREEIQILKNENYE